MGNTYTTVTSPLFFLACSLITSVTRNMFHPALQMFCSTRHHLHEYDIPEEICLLSGVKQGKRNIRCECSASTSTLMAPGKMMAERCREEFASFTKGSVAYKRTKYAQYISYSIFTWIKYDKFLKTTNKSQALKW